MWSRRQALTVVSQFSGKMVNTGILMGQISFHTLSERHYSVVFVIHMKSTSADEDVLTVAWPDG